MKTCLPRRGALLLLALLLLCLPALPACGIITINDPYQAAETTVGAVETTEQSVFPESETAPSPAIVSPESGSAAKAFVDALPSADFENVATLITCAVDTSRFLPENGDSPISAAVAERNRLVEEKLNTAVIAQAADLNTISSEIRASSLSGTYYSELIAIPASALGSLQKNGLLMNLNSLPHVDLSANYYSASAIRQFSCNGKVYGAAGSATAFSEDLYALFVNNSLAERLGISGLASSVYRGEWTLDRFYEAVKGSTAVFGIYGFGYDIGRKEMASAFYTASGCEFVSYGEDGRPMLNADTKTDAIVEKLRGLYDNSYRYYLDDGKALNAFYDGKMLFYISTPGMLPWFHDMTDNWGILPLPKADSTQENHLALVSPSATVIAVPSESSVTDKAGLFMQTLFAASYQTVRDSYVDFLIENYARDNDTLNMADLIGKSAVYDFSSAFGSAYPAIGDACASALDQSLREGRSFQTVVEQRRNAFNRALNSF